MTEQKLQELLNSMSLEEKVNQLVQLTGNWYEENAVITGGMNGRQKDEKLWSQAGSTLGLYGAKKLKQIQKEYMEKQPHHIPLLFMLDVIHGFKTVFPCPLGQGASFSPKTTEACAAVAAKEASAAGVHVTFAPMADLVRDARWGRVMESTGEDPYLNGLMAAAMVKGFQGESAGEKGGVAACVKHFAAYGGAVAGLDYQNVELSEHTLREFYLPAYKKAIDAGCKMAMTSFNTWNGFPSSGSKKLMKEILRKEMGFDGVLISDWNAIGEMIKHGFCEDNREAAKKAIEAGVDIDMCADAYADYLKELVEKGEVEEALVDESVMRVLRLKNELGLFENPYKDADEAQEKALFYCKEHMELARKAVRESIVLLKNEADEKGKKLLPLEKTAKIAFIGPYVEDQDMRSSWAVVGGPDNMVSIRAAAEECFDENQVSFHQGCTLLDNGTLINLGYYEEENWEEKNKQLLSEALESAKEADTVVLCLGESRGQSGEATSRANITLPAIQKKLLRQVQEVNPNVVVVLFNGRPLELTEESALARAIVEAWLPGTEGGHGVLDVLTGAYNPSGKLSMSFPYTVGQVPICYNHYSSGRPRPEEGAGAYTCRYLDVSNEPLYCFGYGLSYTEFAYSGLEVTDWKKVDAEEGELESWSTSLTEGCEIQPGDTILCKVTAKVKNVGSVAGTEIAQLYIQDWFASRVRPVKELKAFRRVSLEPDCEKEVTFYVTDRMLSFYREDDTFGWEAGSFSFWVGGNSAVRDGVEYRIEAR